MRVVWMFSRIIQYFLLVKKFPTKSIDVSDEFSYIGDTVKERIESY
jgi:hypothetical protein